MTDVTIYYPEGSIILSAQDVDLARELQQRLIQLRQLEWIQAGKILSEVRNRKLHFALNQDSMVTRGEGFQTDQMEEESFIIWATRVTGLSRSNIYLKIKVYELLNEAHPDILKEWLDDDGILPDIKRLGYLCHKNRGEHPEIKELLRDAKLLAPVEWEARIKTAYDGMPEEEAQEEAERVVRHRRRKVDESYGGTLQKRPRWESKHFRRFIGRLRCAITGIRKFGEVHPAHIVGQGEGGDDFLNITPLHLSLHTTGDDAQHELTPEEWDKVLESYGKTREDLLLAAEDALIEYLIWVDERLDWMELLERKVKLYNSDDLIKRVLG